MAEPEDMIVPMLCEIRAEIKSLNTQADGLRSHMDERFDDNDKAHTTFRHALAGDTLLGRLLTGEFEERIEKLEKYGERIAKLDNKLRAFEGRS